MSTSARSNSTPPSSTRRRGQLVRRATRRLRKGGYYLASLGGLARLARVSSLLAAGCFGRGRTLRLRDGTSLTISARIDLLIIKETIIDDVYGLRDLRPPAGAVIVDVGAGIGEFAIAAARRFPGVDVLAFEPNPAAFELLVGNARRNGIRSLDARCLAVGAAPGYDLQVGAAGASATAVPAAVPRSERALRVPAARLDRLIGDRDVELLKVDCEGLELDVLDSAAGVLARVRRVVVEYHRHLLPDADGLVSRLLTGERFVVRRVPDRFDDAIGYVYAWR